MFSLRFFLIVVLFATLVWRADYAYAQKTEITSLELDRTELSLQCEPGRRSPLTQCGGDMVINVSTVTNDNSKTAQIQYKINAGKILGEGKNVKWDLSGVGKGTYTINAAMEGCNGNGCEAARSVSIVDCPDCGCGLIECGTISILEPGDPDESGRLVFTASVSGSAADTIEYKWTVVGGEILEGQGTPSILVKLTKDVASPASVTLDLDFNDEKINTYCPRTVTKTISEKP